MTSRHIERLNRATEVMYRVAMGEPVYLIAESMGLHRNTVRHIVRWSQKHPQVAKSVAVRRQAANTWEEAA